ncbi:hypothetical protein BY996DRAFT_6857297 [Phakopsora pachyrhizi]|nr:hypothetical protein BY996DRAFT_6857297 [Phakopsora pachyrhizi]
MCSISFSRKNKFNKIYTRMYTIMVANIPVQQMVMPAKINLIKFTQECMPSWWQTFLCKLHFGFSVLQNLIFILPITVSSLAN